MDECEADFVDLLLSPSFSFELRDRLGFLIFITKVRIIKLKENPLSPANILGLGRIHFTIPVVAETKFLKLTAEVICICLCGNAWVLVGLDRVLLSRKSKSVPPHWVQNVKSIHPLVAAHDVGSGVSLRMAHMKALSTRVREHVENVVFWLGRVETFVTWTGSAVGLILSPVRLPFGLKSIEGIRFTFFGHDVEQRKAMNEEKNTQKKLRRPSCGV